MNILYTAMCGDYDEPKPIKPPKEGWRYLFFTDDPNLQVEGWEMVLLPESNLSPKMKAKEPKIKPHEFLPKHSYSMWIDASYEVKLGVNALLLPYLEKDVTMSIHPSKRKSIYDEADKIVIYGLDTPENVDAVVKRYKDLGFCGSFRSHVYQADVIIRKNNRKSATFNQEWWNEILQTSTRDQLSLPYVLSKQANLNFGKMAYGQIGFIMKKHPHKRAHNNLFFINPYGFELKIGDRLNYEIERMPDDAWVVMTDQDVAIVTEKAGDMLDNAIKRYPDTDLFGCYTNRVGLSYQKWPEIDSENMNMEYHHSIAQQKLRQYYNEAEDIDKPIAGFFMMFPKKTWEKYNFQPILIDRKKTIGDKTGIYFDYEFSHRILTNGGKIRLLKGLYAVHFYRLNRGLRDVEHLTTVI